MSELMGIMLTILGSKDDRPKKVSCYGAKYTLLMLVTEQIEKLRNTLSTKKNLLEFRRPIRLPLDPATVVTGLVAENASMFKSALNPAKLAFTTTSGALYWVSTSHASRVCDHMPPTCAHRSCSRLETT